MPQTKKPIRKRSPCKTKDIESLTCIYCDIEHGMKHMFYDCVNTKELWNCFKPIFRAISLFALNVIISF